ncbi:MAG: cell division protein SepF [Lachnospiraceae bacterium]|nr:cell division protein SepF [Lachnospiraceae bacterium]
MSIFDNFLNFMRLNPDDEEYDDDDFVNEEYYYDDDFDDEPKKPSKKEVKQAAKEAAAKETVKEKEKARPISKITPISKSSKKQGGASMQVCVIKPTSIEEEIEITETLLEGRTVVINMEGLNVEIAQRIIDFTSGATYAMNGNLQKISNYIFLATPNGVDISGDIQSIMDSFGSSNTYTF